MKKLWLILGAIALGIIFLPGCGDRQTETNSSLQPVEMGESGTEASEQDSRKEGSQKQDGREGDDERITLTLGAVDSSRNLQNIVDAYNAQNEKYYVEIVDYLPEQYDNAIYEASLDRLRMDLATGKGTDMVVLGDLVADELGYAGVLTDLNSFLTYEAKQEKYLSNILECAQTGGALYEISPTFKLEFIVGDGSRIGMDNGWTLAEMLESFERNGRDGAALAKGGVRTSARLVEYSIEDYVDWDAGKADFCNEEFYQILEFGKIADSGEYIRPTRESASSGTHLASCEMLVTLVDIQEYHWLFGDDMAIKGWPCSHGTGVAMAFGGEPIGISAYSQYPEGAWNFLDFYAGGSWIEKKTFWSLPGLPLNKALFEEVLEQSTVQQYTDTGEPVTLLIGEGDRPDFYANTAEDVEALRELVALADRRCFSSQSAISRIMEEEINGYNTGILTVEQAAANIQNRIQLYLDEQK